MALKRRGVRFVIDWHNLGYTVLRLRLGQWHPAVRFARWFERRDARRADANLCVSRALAAFLQSRFGVTTAHVLYDRPASPFTPVQRGEREQYRQALFSRLGIHTEKLGFIVCPTSWTERRGFRFSRSTLSCASSSGSADGKRLAPAGDSPTWSYS